MNFILVNYQHKFTEQTVVEYYRNADLKHRLLIEQLLILYPDAGFTS